MHVKKLKIVIGSLMVGGTETFLVRYLSELVFQGWDVEVYTLAYHPGVLAPILENNRVKITPLLTQEDYQKLSCYPTILEKMIRIFLSVSRLSHHLRYENDAILHLFLPEAYVLGGIAAGLARFQGMKVMSRRSLNNYQKKRPVVAWLEKKLHRYMDVIIGNSAMVMKQLQEEGIHHSKLRLIYNGLKMGSDPINDPGNNLLLDFHFEEDTLIFIIVANLIPYKGHEDLLNAFHLIKDKIKQPWKLLCVGRDQGIEQHLKALAEKFHIADNILWLGERKDVPQLLKLSDVGILCSHEEGFSNAVLEAMAAGLPMVVTDVGGNAEAVLQGETGYVVPPKNPKALGDALLALASDQNKMQNFGSKALQRVTEHFTLDLCVAEHIKAYQSTIYS